MIFKYILFSSLTLTGLSAQITKFVNPFIGTGGHGHTFPGACKPFGMVQLSPDTRLDGWDGCSGYHYSDSIIYGFSHTHLSGTGVPDYCDILIMPGTKTLSHEVINSKYLPSKFNKKKEIAKAGFYGVFLEDSNIYVKLTATDRTGVHEYKYPDSRNNWIVINLEHRDKVLNAGFDEWNSNQISGHRISTSWAKEQSIYFSLKFSQNLKKFYFSDDSLRLYCLFDNLKNNTLKIQCAISAVDIAGAKENLSAEWVNFNFEKARKKCDSDWNKMLSRIRIEDNNIEKSEKKIIFYTALYHSLIHPSLHQDADHRYRGMDNKIHLGKAEHPRYTVFSLWDTYRAAHPLYQLLYPEFNYYFAKSFLGQYHECGRLPVWELASNETYCMIGNHSIPVLVNAFLNQTRERALEKQEVLEAIEGTFNKGFSNIEEFKKAYISLDKGSESVSKTIENSLDYYAYKIISNSKSKEDKYYQNLYNPSTGFFQAKLNSGFTKFFDPYEVNFNYTEANAWQYLMGAHHDVEGMIDCFNRDPKNLQVKLGHNNNSGNALESKLDSLFGTSSYMSGRVQPDITGLIGQYAHGNEPSHHVAYLYNYCNRYDKTQRIINRIITTLYSNQADGLCGNEDCGQMSAWYIFSALGFYPVNPISSEYQPGIPLFDRISLKVPGNKRISIVRENYTPNGFVNEININKNSIYSSFTISAGDYIKYSFEQDKYLKFISSSSLDYYEPVPFVEKGEQVFEDSTLLQLKNYSKSRIELSLDSLFIKPKKYIEPIVIKEPISYYFRNESSINNPYPNIQKVKFSKKPSGFKYHIVESFENQYSAGGRDALFDGLYGSIDYRDGRWQGYWGKDIQVELEIKNPDVYSSLKITSLQDQNSWILLPKEIELYISEDREEYILFKVLDHQINKKTNDPIIHEFEFKEMTGKKFIKLIIKNSGKLPPWHLSAGEKSWIFLDEITIN